MGPRADLEGRKSRPHRDSIPDRPAPSSVVIPTELPGPPIELGRIRIQKDKWEKRHVSQLVDRGFDIHWRSRCAGLSA